MLKVVRRSQLKEWTEASIVEIVIQCLQGTLDAAAKERSECFLPGEAHKTQEIRSMYMGGEEILKQMIDFLRMDEDALQGLFQENGVEILDEETDGK